LPGRPAAGGGRWVTVAPERLHGWLTRFEASHGQSRYDSSSEVVRVTAEDGSTAEIEVPFPPLLTATSPSGQAVGGPALAEDLTGPKHGTGDALVEHVTRPRTVGVLLVRLGGHAAGVFEGDRLVASKVGSTYVQGRTAAGGWSQQRFARRRSGQATVAYNAAADCAAGVLLRHELEGVVVGGDRKAVDAVLADPRLSPLQPLVTGRLLAVPDPRLKVLQECRWRDVWVRVTEPGAAPAPAPPTAS